MDNEEKYRFSTELFKRIRVGLLGGLAAGALIGLAEGAWLLVMKWGVMSWGVLLYGAILYGLVGGSMGLGLGVLLAAVGALRRRSGKEAGLYALVFAVVFALNGLVIFRFRVFRDVMHEQPIPLMGNLLLLAVFGVLFFLFAFGLRVVLAGTAFGRVTRIPGTAILLAALVFVLFMLKLAMGYVLVVKSPQQLAAGLAGSEKTPNIVLIMVDALRADRLSCYGYERNETPAIDALAADGILFEKTFGQSSWTRPATASLLTSLYSSAHKTYLKPDMLPDEVLSLPEVLKRSGYLTVGYADNINITDTFNFQQGFDQFVYLAPDYFFMADESSSQLAYYSVLRLIRERFLVKGKYVQHYYQDADVVNEHLFATMEKSDPDRALFLYAHYMEPHDPYFRHPYDGYGIARVSMPEPDPAMTDELLQLYDEEITFLDERLKMLFDRMKELDLYDDSIIVLTADHGEEFYDHQGWWHGLTLYQEQIEIPLIIKLPGKAHAGTRVPNSVRQIDIAPTLSALAGLGVPAEFQGVDLMPAVKELFDRADGSAPDEDGGAVEEAATASSGIVTGSGEGLAEEQTAVGEPWPVEAIFSEEDHEGNVIQSIIQGDWKLIRANEGNPRGLPVVELFNVREDPTETDDLSAEFQTKVDELTSLIEEYLTRALESGVARQEGGEMDEATRNRLQALGYME